MCKYCGSFPPLPPHKNKPPNTHLAFVKIRYDFLIQLLFKLLLGIHIVSVPLKQMGYTGLVRPLKNTQKQHKRWMQHINSFKGDECNKYSAAKIHRNICIYLWLNHIFLMIYQTQKLHTHIRIHARFKTSACHMDTQGIPMKVRNEVRLPTIMTAVALVTTQSK